MDDGQDMRTSHCLKENDATVGHETRPSRRPAADPQFCRTCYHEVSSGLEKLPGDYADWADEAVLPRRHPARQRVSGSRTSTGIVLDDESMESRSGILSFLVSWSALVADERDVPGPDGRTPGMLADFLLRHLTWLLEHLAVEDFVLELEQLPVHAGDAIRPDPTSQVELGQCVHAGCVAAMATSPVHAKRSEVRCDAGHSWPPHQWLQLWRTLAESSA
jgi:hypothetical protein